MGTHQRKAKEKERRRQAIMDVARSLFFEKRYDGTTVPDIAAAAELAPGTIYLYFPNKDALYVELLFEGYALLEERLEQAFHSHAAPADRMESLISAFFRFAVDFPEYFDIIFFVVQKERCGGWNGSLHMEQLLRLEARLAACKTLFRKALEPLQPEPGVPGISATVDTIWTMLTGVVFFFRKKKVAATFEAMTAEAGRLVLNGISKEADREQNSLGIQNAPMEQPVHLD